MSAGALAPIPLPDHGVAEPNCSTGSSDGSGARSGVDAVRASFPERGQVGRAHPTRHSRLPHNLRTCRDQRTHADVRTCGPRRVRIASGEDDNDFAGCASLTDMSKRGGNLVERERPVDVDPDVPGHAEGGKRLEVGRPLLDGKDPDCATGEPPNQPAGGKHAQQRGHRPTHASIVPPGASARR